jgi:hypothetical protein
MHQLHALRQQMIDPMLDNGVRLPSADLHQYPWARLNAPHLAHNLFGYVTVTVFIKKFHCR